MPITRTPMVDDDGSGTTGTILNNAWKQELYGQIDGLFAPLILGPGIAVPDFTGPQIDNLAGNGTYTTWFLKSTGPTYLTGIVAPPHDGTVHILINVGVPLITLAHLFGSTVPNQILGAGYANTDLPTWRAVTLQYVFGYSKWVVFKP
jgi:hypothetical protein